MAPVRARLFELLPDPRLELLENTRFNPGETRNDQVLRARARRRVRSLRQRCLRLGPSRALLDGGRRAPASQLRRPLAPRRAPQPRAASRRGRSTVRDRLGRGEGGRQGCRPRTPGLARRPCPDRGARWPRMSGAPITLLWLSTCSSHATSSPRRASRPTPQPRTVRFDALPPGWLGLDIGPDAAEEFAAAIDSGGNGVLERADGRLRVAPLRRRHLRDRSSGRALHRLQRRRGRRFGQGRARGGRCRRDFVDLDRGRRVRSRIPRGQGAAGRGGAPGGLIPRRALISC